LMKILSFYQSSFRRDFLSCTTKEWTIGQVHFCSVTLEL
jgi:hypothetical protein